MLREPIQPPQDVFPATEPLPNLIRRIVRDELRPIHQLLEEMRDALTGPPAG